MTQTSPLTENPPAFIVLTGHGIFQTVELESDLDSVLDGLEAQDVAYVVYAHDKG